jgi:hypothetical protein
MTGASDHLNTRSQSGEVAGIRPEALVLSSVNPHYAHARSHHYGEIGRLERRQIQASYARRIAATRAGKECPDLPYFLLIAKLVPKVKFHFSTLTEGKGHRTNPDRPATGAGKNTNPPADGAIHEDEVIEILGPPLSVPQGDDAAQGVTEKSDTVMTEMSARILYVPCKSRQRICLLGCIIGFPTSPLIEEVQAAVGRDRS